jgi:WD40 repeat protein
VSFRHLCPIRTAHFQPGVRRWLSVALCLLVAPTGTTTAEPPSWPPRTDLYGDLLPSGAIARLGTVRLRHPDRVTSVGFTPDGKTVVAGCLDGDGKGPIRFWDPSTGRLLRCLDLPYGTESLAVSPDGRTLAAQGGGRNYVYLWDVATGKRTHRLPREGNRHTLSVAFSPDSTTLATAECDAGVQLWDVATGRLLREIGEPGSQVVYSPDGKTIALLRSESPLHGGNLSLWDVASGAEVWSLPLPARWPSQSAVSPDGKLLAACADDGTVRLVETGSGTERGRLKHNKVCAVAFALGGQVLASGEDDGTIRIWDVGTGKQTRHLRGHVSSVNALAFSPDAKTLLSGGTDNCVGLWDVANGHERLPFAGHQHMVLSVAFAPDGRTLASGSIDGTTRLWDRATGRERLVLPDQQGTVKSVAFSPDGKMLASGGDDGRTRLYDVARGKVLRRLGGQAGEVYAVAFSPDGSLVASADRDVGIHFWQVLSGRLLRRLASEHGNWVPNLAFSPDGKRYVSGREDGTVHLRDASTGKAVRERSGHERELTAAAFSPDGRTLATGSDDRTIVVWDVGSGQEHLRLTGHEGGVTWVVFAPDGRTLASGSQDGTVRVWEAASGKEARCFRGHTDGVNCVAFAPDGRALVSGSRDYTLLLWDLTGLSCGDGRLADQDLTEGQLAMCWQDLAGADVPKAHRAVWSLAAGGDRAARFLGTKLAPVPAAVKDHIPPWVAALDDDDFAVRQKATRELERVGLLAEAPLRRAQGRGPSAEARRRITALLEKLEAPVPPPGRVREIRALAALEQIATPVAQAVLQRLAEGASEAWLTQEAKGSLKRLAARAGLEPRGGRRRREKEERGMIEWGALFCWPRWTRDSGPDTSRSGKLVCGRARSEK